MRIIIYIILFQILHASKFSVKMPRASKEKESIDDSQKRQQSKNFLGKEYYLEIKIFDFEVLEVTLLLLLFQKRTFGNHGISTFDWWNKKLFTWNIREKLTLWPIILKGDWATELSQEPNFLNFSLMLHKKSAKYAYTNLLLHIHDQRTIDKTSIILTWTWSNFSLACCIADIYTPTLQQQVQQMPTNQLLICCFPSSK